MNWQPPDELHFRGRTPGSHILLALITVGFAVLGYTVSTGWYYFAAILGVCLLASWCSLPRKFSLRFYHDRREVCPSGLRIPYEAITELRLSERSVIHPSTIHGSPYFVIGHTRGILRLPHHDAVDRIGLYEWLVSKTPLLARPDLLPGRLDEVRAKDINDFGEQQVLATVARPITPGEFDGSNSVISVRNLWFFTFGLGAACIVATVLGSATELQAGLGGSAVTMMVFALICTAHRNGRRRILEKLRNGSGLVISPRSLTMESQQLKGMLRWAEVKEMKLMPKKANVMSGILLKIDGSQIVIGDHYQFPLTEIHRRIESYIAHEE